MLEKISEKNSNCGLKCDLYGISMQAMVRNILHMKPLVLFAFDVWQTACSRELKEDECWLVLGDRLQRAPAVTENYIVHCPHHLSIGFRSSRMQTMVWCKEGS